MSGVSHQNSLLRAGVWGASRKEKFAFQLSQFHTKATEPRQGIEAAGQLLMDRHRAGVRLRRSWTGGNFEVR